jgi:hypothetical protein
LFQLPAAPPPPPRGHDASRLCPVPFARQPGCPTTHSGVTPPRCALTLNMREILQNPVRLRFDSCFSVFFRHMTLRIVHAPTRSDERFR